MWSVELRAEWMASKKVVPMVVRLVVAKEY